MGVVPQDHDLRTFPGSDCFGYSLQDSDRDSPNYQRYFTTTDSVMDVGTSSKEMFNENIVVSGRDQSFEFR